MDFKGEARRLQSLDISRLAHTIGCGEDHLHAVMEVETRGGGFDHHGRIKMLFEPHIFYRELSGSRREEAVAAGLAYRRWGERRYPRDSYSRLERAMAIDAEAALRSCSWGLGQIMGFNHRPAGYGSVTAMVEAFRDDEAIHLAAMVEFIVSSGLDDELRREDWRGFARGYNGAGYAKHGYHLKLKRAFDKWQRIPDTPFTPGNIDRRPENPNPPEEPDRTTRGMPLKVGMRGPDVTNLQGILATIGYHSGAQDGIFGRLTKSAVVAFQSDHDLVADGIVGELTWGALEKAKPRPLRDVSDEHLREAGSRTYIEADRAETNSRRAGLGLTGLGTLQTGIGAAEELSRAETALQAAQNVLMTYWPLLLIVGIGFLIYWKGPEIAERFRKIRKDDAVQRKNLGR